MKINDWRNVNRNSLFKVEQPRRYTGGELNSINTPCEFDFNVCLLFPDLYDIGISYYGYQILYHVINSIDGVACERAYLPWKDMQSHLRQRKIPLHSLESGRELADFDLLGITLQSELHYPGVVKALDLAGIPRYSIDRSPEHPLIIGGGPCAFHPEPVSPFFDAFLVGDGEEAFPELIGLMRTEEFRKSDRREQWERLSGMKGMYVPALYRAEDRSFRKIIPVKDAPSKIRARTILSLNPENYPHKPIVPFINVPHNRLTVEIMRGCTQGCRFCQAGMIHRPVRERSVDDILEHVLKGIDNTGFDDIGLLSLSTSDYSRLEELLLRLVDVLKGRKVAVGFPSLRPATFTEELARIDTGGRRSGITFAVEAGSQRLRRVINKHLEEEELMEAIDRAYRRGWSSVKLYFMIGLPTESMQDLQEGADLLHRIASKTPRGRKLHVSVAPLIPKPHSVFALEEYLELEELDERRRVLFGRLNARWVKTDWHDPRMNMIEALLARGDRRLAPVIERVAEEGDGFEAWGGLFSSERWIDALNRLVPEWKGELGTIRREDPKPWDHITKGVTKKFFKQELKAFPSGELLEDCRLSECYRCGLISICRNLPQSNSTANIETCIPGMQESKPGEINVEQQGEKYRYRLVFSKLLRARMLGHQDLNHAIERALRRSGMPLRYSQGFNPKPKLSFGPALSLGVGMLRMWIEFETITEINPDDWLRKLRSFLPFGIRGWELIEVNSSNRLTEVVESSRFYRLKFSGSIPGNSHLERIHNLPEYGLHDFVIDSVKKSVFVETRRVENRFPSAVKLTTDLLEMLDDSVPVTNRIISITKVDNLPQG